MSFQYIITATRCWAANQTWIRWFLHWQNVDIMLNLSKVSPQFSVNIVLPTPKWLLESEYYNKWTILSIIVLYHKFRVVRRQRRFVSSKISIFEDIGWYITETWRSKFKQKLPLSIRKELFYIYWSLSNGTLKFQDTKPSKQILLKNEALQVFQILQYQWTLRHFYSKLLVYDILIPNWWCISLMEVLKHAIENLPIIEKRFLAKFVSSVSLSLNPKTSPKRPLINL